MEQSSGRLAAGGDSSLLRRDQPSETEIFSPLSHNPTCRAVLPPNLVGTGLVPVPHLPRRQLRAISQGRLCVLQEGDQPVHGNILWALTHTIPGKHPAPEGLGCSLKYSDSFPKCQPCSSGPPSAEPVLPASPRTALGLHNPSGGWK